MADGFGELRHVYDLCCPDVNDFILTKVLVEKLSGQFDKNILSKIKDIVDPQEKGKLSFEDFCSAICQLNPTVNKQTLKEEEIESVSDPEFTYNEYDIAEEDIVSDMENFKTFGESINTLSPIPSKELNMMRGNSSLRKSHRRNKSWASQHISNSSHIDDSSSVSSEIDDLAEKVDFLQTSVAKLTEEKLKQVNHESLNQENQLLNTRIHELEGKLQDAIDSLCELRASSSDKYQDLKNKLEREKQLELQFLQGQINMLTKDNERLQHEKEEVSSIRSELKHEVKTLRKMSEDLTSQLVETNEQYRKLSLQYTQQQEKHDVERQQDKTELNEIYSQMYSYQQDKQDLETRLKSIQNSPDANHLQKEIQRLLDDNSRLRAINDELNSELAQNINNVRSIIQENVPGFDGLIGSLAEELSDASKDDLVERLKKQEQVNEHLRQYVDRLLKSVLERDPSILEIKSQE